VRALALEDILEHKLLTLVKQLAGGAVKKLPVGRLARLFAASWRAQPSRRKIWALPRRPAA
jgi:hypothetical protein